MSILDTILSRKTKGPIPVATPEWDELDGTLAIRKLAPAERAAFYELVNAQKPEAGIEFLSLVAAYCTVRAGSAEQGAGSKEQGAGSKEQGAGSKEQGARAFDDGDWRALSTDLGSGSAIERLAAIADEANVLSDGTRERLKKNTRQSPAPAAAPARPRKWTELRRPVERVGRRTAAGRGLDRARSAGGRTDR